MLPLPTVLEPLVLSLCAAFTEPTFNRFAALCVGAILTRGRRTVTGMLHGAGGMAPGHFSDYHRVFSRARWSLWPLGKALATMVLRLVPDGEPVLVPIDDTTAQHKGKCVYGKGCHHDAVRSTHTHVVWRWGHRWVVAAISVALPFTSRRWALPVLAVLYRPEELNRAEKRRHKTPPCLARQMMAVLILWFRSRRFVFLGDGGYASHELASFCSRHARHATLISRFHGDANLYAPPTTRKRTGRPPLKGAKLPTPAQTVARSKRIRATVSWYGGQTRRVELVSGTGLWYKSGEGVVPVRWVHVHDIQGTHRDDYVYSTDLSLSPAQIVSWFTARWPIETTFQEVRAHLGFETPRQRVAKSVLRTAPCLLGLFSLIAVAYAEHLRRHQPKVARTAWYHKTEPTFADALNAIRRLLWTELLSARGHIADVFQKLPPPYRRMVLDNLCSAA